MLKAPPTYYFVKLEMRVKSSLLRTFSRIPQFKIDRVVVLVLENKLFTSRMKERNNPVGDATLRARNGAPNLTISLAGYKIIWKCLRLHKASRGFFWG